MSGDIAFDNESRISYMVLGTQVWQSANPNITDSHHIKLILRAVTGFPSRETLTYTTTSKGRITT